MTYINMRLLLTFLSIVAIASCEDWTPKSRDEIKSIRNECLAQNPITEEQSTKLKSFQFPDEESVRKLILCTVKKLEVFCEHEGFHVDRIVKLYKLKIDETEANEIAGKCADKNDQKSSEDVWAFRAHECLMNTKLGESIKEVIKNAQAAKA